MKAHDQTQASPPAEAKIPVEEALDEAHRNGLFTDMDLAAFKTFLGRHGRTVTGMDSSDLLHEIVARHLEGTPGVLVANERDGVVAERDLHEGEEPEVLAELTRFAAHFGVLEELQAEVAELRAARRADDDDLLDQENLFLVLGRTFVRARRPERVVLLKSRGVDNTAIVVRKAMVPGKLHLFGGEHDYRPQDDRRKGAISLPD